MKSLEKLKIHPAPWMVRCKKYPPAGILARDGSRVDEDVSVGDNCLMAAAPELYECLREAVDFHCGKCINKGGQCNTDCLFYKWRAALAKAAGEEAK